MARASKEGLVVVVDTSASMAEPYPVDGLHGAGGGPPSKLEVAKEIVALVLGDRAVAEQGLKAKCEASVVAFGTDETAHSIQDLGAAYAHMVEVFPLDGLHPVSFARTMALRPAAPGVQGDVLSALILAFTLLQERTAHFKTDRRIVVITDGCSRIGSADGLEDVVGAMEEYGVRVSVVGFNFPRAVLTGSAEEDNDDDAAGQAGMDAGRRLVVGDNARMLQSIVECTLGAKATAGEKRGAMQEAREALAHWAGNLRKRANSANSNLSMHLTSRLSFNVQAAAITMPARPPSLKLSSREDVTNSKLAMERRYVDAEEGPASAEVAAHERVRGFQYGGELLPVDQAAEAALKWQEEEVAMRLVTFLPAAKVKRWHALSNAMAIKPHAKDGYPRNALLLASLGQALRRSDCMALVRYHRRKTADPELGILAPPAVRLSPDTGDVVKLKPTGDGDDDEGEEAPLPYLVYNKLPFEEDIRGYSFRPLDASNTRHYPKEEEKAAALALVDALTLPMDPATGSALRLVPHPGIRAVYQAALAKAVAKGIEDEEAAAAEGEDEDGEGQNPLGRASVVEWGKQLRAAQAGALDADGMMEEDEGRPPPVSVPFLGFATGQAAVDGEAALPTEMRRDPEMWGRAKGAIKRFASEFPLEVQEPKQKKQNRTWTGDITGSDYTNEAVPAAAAAAAAGATSVTPEEGMDEGGATAATGLSLAMAEPESAEEEEEGAAAGAPMEVAEEAAAPAPDATYAVAGKAVPTKLDRGKLEEELPLMLGAGGAHAARALTELKALLVIYLERAEEGQSSFYKRARDALKDLREASITAQRPPEEFNGFMREHVKQGLCKGGGAAGGDLWRLLQQDGVTLREVGEAEARAFLEEAEGVATAPAPAPVAALQEEGEEIEFE